MLRYVIETILSRCNLILLAYAQSHVHTHCTLNNTYKHVLWEAFEGSRKLLWLFQGFVAIHRSFLYEI